MLKSHEPEKHPPKVYKFVVIHRQILDVNRTISEHLYLKGVFYQWSWVGETHEVVVKKDESEVANEL